MKTIIIPLKSNKNNRRKNKIFKMKKKTNFIILQTIIINIINKKKIIRDKTKKIIKKTLQFGNLLNLILKNLIQIIYYTKKTKIIIFLQKIYIIIKL